MTDPKEGTSLVMVNGRWPLYLPDHRAARPEWPWWEATRLAAMHHCIRELVGPASQDPPVVWDVGAEEGDFPALWASWGCDVVMAEPNPRVWPNIKLVWEANGLDDPLMCWPGFLADGEFLYPPTTSWLEVVGRGDWPASADGPVISDHGFCQWGERPDIQATSVDALVALGAPFPSVLTMDVEGSELHVLRGAVATLEDYHRPDVFVSVHPAFMAHHYGITDGTRAVREFMAGVGYPPDHHVFLGTDHEEHWWFRP